MKEDKKEQTVDPAAKADLQAIMQAWASFTVSMASAGKAMPTAGELFIMARIAKIENRLAKLETPPVVVVP